VELYQNGSLSLVKRPRSLDTKVQRSINRERRSWEFGTFFQYGRRIAAAVLIACLLSFAAVMSVEAVRTTLWDTIVRFFDEFLSISYVTETQPPKQLEAIKEPSGPFFCQSPMSEHIRHIDAYIPHKNRPLKCRPFRLDF
jgi:hypothetical protein